MWDDMCAPVDVVCARCVRVAHHWSAPEKREQPRVVASFFVFLFLFFSSHGARRGPLTGENTRARACARGNGSRRGGVCRQSVTH